MSFRFSYPLTRVLSGSKRSTNWIMSFELTCYVYKGALTIRRVGQITMELHWKIIQQQIPKYYISGSPWITKTVVFKQLPLSQPSSISTKLSIFQEQDNVKHQENFIERHRKLRLKCKIYTDTAYNIIIDYLKSTHTERLFFIFSGNELTFISGIY